MSDHKTNGQGHFASELERQVAEELARLRPTHRRPRYINRDVQRLTVVLDAEWLEALDEWRKEQPGLPSRPEAVRRVMGQVFGGQRSGGGQRSKDVPQEGGRFDGQQRIADSTRQGDVYGN